MTDIPDPHRSRALLVGVADYPRMPPERQLSTVRPGLGRLAELLQEPDIWGLPAENCKVLDQPADSDTVVSELGRAAKEASDALVFYYAGHGLVDPVVGEGELHLGLPQSYEPGGTQLALRYAHIRREFHLSAHIKRRLVILDCCWSGGALGSTMSGGDLAAEMAIEGAAVLTATSSTRKALAPPNEQYPAFTGALIDTLSSGIAGAPEFLDAGTIFRHLTAVQAGRGYPRPQLGGTGSGPQLAMFRNRAWQRSATPAPPPAVTQPPSADRVRLLRRLGRYREADELQRQAAMLAEPAAVRGRASELRRSSEYQRAMDLEEPG